MLKGANWLDLVPIRVVSDQVNADDTVTLFVPKFTHKLLCKLVVPLLKDPYVKIKLNDLAAATWLAIDGKKNVEFIIHELTQKFGDKIQPAESRIIKFLSMLYEQKLIFFNIIS